jgi:vacuolar-type H+-ATPase subunit B/Vma2
MLATWLLTVVSPRYSSFATSAFDSPRATASATSSSRPRESSECLCPDLTGYINERQIVLSRELERRGVSPPLAILPSLGLLMNAGIRPGKTREDPRAVADQLYAALARGRDLRRLVSIIGEAALSERDRRSLVFGQGGAQWL